MPSPSPSHIPAPAFSRQAVRVPDTGPHAAPPPCLSLQPTVEPCRGTPEDHDQSPRLYPARTHRLDAERAGRAQVPGRPGLAMDLAEDGPRFRRHDQCLQSLPGTPGPVCRDPLARDRHRGTEQRRYHQVPAPPPGRRRSGDRAHPQRLPRRRAPLDPVPVLAGGLRHGLHLLQHRHHGLRAQHDHGRDSGPDPGGPRAPGRYPPRLAASTTPLSATSSSWAWASPCSTSRTSCAP